LTDERIFKIPEVIIVFLIYTTTNRTIYLFILFHLI